MAQPQAHPQQQPPQPNPHPEPANNPQQRPQKPLTAEERTRQLWMDLLIGSAAAAFSKTLAAPFERIKLIQQHESWLLAQGKITRRYTGVIDCLLETVKEEGVLSLWKGNLWSVIRYFPTQFFNLFMRDILKGLVPTTKTDPFWLIWAKSFFSGGFSGLASLVFVYPLDTLRTIEAIDTQRNRLFPSTLDILLKSWETSYGLSLYSGFANSAIGVLAYRFNYFAFYDLLTAAIKAKRVSLSFAATFMLGFGVSQLAGTITYPLDTVRRWEMIYALTQGSSNSVTVFLDILQNEGVKGFLAGNVANTLRGMGGAASLFVWDAAIAKLRR